MVVIIVYSYETFKGTRNLKINFVYETALVGISFKTHVRKHFVSALRQVKLRKTSKALLPHSNAAASQGKLRKERLRNIDWI